MMTWTRGWRDMSVIIGHNFETAHYFDRNSIHALRAMSVIFGHDMKPFTVMTWTPDSTHGWRDMSVEARHDYEATCLSDRDSIETRRDMSVTKPPHETAVHHRSRLIFEKLTFIKKLEKWKGDFGF